MTLRPDHSGYGSHGLAERHMSSLHDAADQVSQIRGRVGRTQRTPDNATDLNAVWERREEGLRYRVAQEVVETCLLAKLSHAFRHRRERQWSTARNRRGRMGSIMGSRALFFLMSKRARNQ